MVNGLKRLAVLALAALVAGCGTLDMRQAVPANLQTVVRPADLPPEGEYSIFGDAPTQDFLRWMAVRETQRAQNGARYRPQNFLALSGGGGDGAFGAGLLTGWTGNGRPAQFDMVTGISTGALIAPFAFLGPRYDPVLKKIYTTVSDENLFITQIVAGLTGGTALTDNTPLKELIAEYASDRLIADVGRAYAQGRRLFVGTTNLDAQRPVLWDLTRIAAHGTPAARALFRDVLLASTSIPGVFPPVLVTVTKGDREFQEMHVDGGTTKGVYALPDQFALQRVVPEAATRVNRTLYVVRNGKLAPEYRAVKSNVFDIAGRSISTLIKQQNIAEIDLIYIGARNNNVAFNLAAIPAAFTEVSKTAFDLDYMRALFAIGQEAGQAGGRWVQSPPSLLRQAAQPR